MHVFYHLALRDALIPLEKPALSHLGSSRYAFSLKDGLSGLSQIYQLI